MISSLFTSLVLLSACVHAFVPRQTTAAGDILDPQGWSPRPTSSPSHPANIFERQFFPNDAGTVLVAPDNTCGYISGLQVGAVYYLYRHSMKSY